MSIKKIKFIFFADRFLQRAAPIQQSRMSLPAFGRGKRIIVPDAFGIEREHHVNDQTLQHVRSIIQAANTGHTGYMHGVGQSSFGSLPSGTSLASSQSSFASQTSQASTAGIK